MSNPMNALRSLTAVDYDESDQFVRKTTGKLIADGARLGASGLGRGTIVATVDCAAFHEVDDETLADRLAAAYNLCVSVPLDLLVDMSASAGFRADMETLLATWVRRGLRQGDGPDLLAEGPIDQTDQENQTDQRQEEEKVK